MCRAGHAKLVGFAVLEYVPHIGHAVACLARLNANFVGRIAKSRLHDNELQILRRFDNEPAVVALPSPCGQIRLQQLRRTARNPDRGQVRKKRRLGGWRGRYTQRNHRTPSKHRQSLGEHVPSPLQKVGLPGGTFDASVPAKRLRSERQLPHVSQLPRDVKLARRFSRRESGATPSIRRSFRPAGP